MHVRASILLLAQRVHAASLMPGCSPNARPYMKGARTALVASGPPLLLLLLCMLMNMPLGIAVQQTCLQDCQLKPHLETCHPSLLVVGAAHTPAWRWVASAAAHWMPSPAGCNVKRRAQPTAVIFR